MITASIRAAGTVRVARWDAWAVSARIGVRAEPLLRLLRTYPPGGFETIHFRHLHIHQHQVKGAFLQEMRHASTPLTARVTFQPWRRSMEPTTFWLIGLSSATSTRKPAGRAPGPAAGSPALYRGAGATAVAPTPVRQRSSCPAPGSLSAQRRPPISWTRRRVIVKPSPVPPNCRVCDPSACVKASKIGVQLVWPRCRFRCRAPRSGPGRRLATRGSQ